MSKIDGTLRFYLKRFSVFLNLELSIDLFGKHSIKIESPLDSIFEELKNELKIKNVINEKLFEDNYYNKEIVDNFLLKNEPLLQEKVNKILNKKIPAGTISYNEYKVELFSYTRYDFKGISRNERFNDPLIVNYMSNYTTVVHLQSLNNSYSLGLNSLFNFFAKYNEEEKGDFCFYKGTGYSEDVFKKIMKNKDFINLSLLKIKGV